MWKMVAVGSLSAAIAAATALGPEAARASQQEIDLLRGTDAPPNAIWLDSLDLSKMVQRRQMPRAGRSLAGGSGGRRGAGGAAGPPGSPITLGGVTYRHGIGTLSINELIVDLKGQATRFLAMAGLNDNAGRQGSVTVEAWLDNRKVLIVALFNRGLQAATVNARWSDIGVMGRQPVRDLWQQRDIGTFADRFSTRVPAHGAVLVKVGRVIARTM